MFRAITPIHDENPCICATAFIGPLTLLGVVIPERSLYFSHVLPVVLFLRPNHHFRAQHVRGG